ncbi:MAG: TIGR03986 family CRISPR-associated RAMP protein [Microcoleus sp.]|uniref:TIGR03986 family type III CRISPR-associated RAMP protein n=1 Tax=Microcoleus sp. TaxID=44472 RepID=UPI003C75867A
MNPKHIKQITDSERVAKAPYNFVELPEKVVEAELPLPEGDRYHLERHTGRIKCTLTTESPLYIRCGITPSDFIKYSELPEKYSKLPKNATDQQKKQWEDEKKQWETERKTVLAPFFTYRSDDLLPVLPGSSLRGMLRTLVEIISFSKIDRVSDEHRLFFRAVAANKNKESWGEEYKKYVEPEKIQAGYLKKDPQGCWYIQPAIKDKGVTFAWVQEDELTEITGFKKFDARGYEPQYFKVSYQSLEKREEKRNGKVIAERWFAQNVKSQETEPSSQVVTSGNMKQKEDSSSPRCNHCVVFAEDENADPSCRLRIDDTAIKHYRNALTDFQKKSPFDKDWGLLKLEAEKDRPVFYSDPGDDKIVRFFGQSPNFRIPYSPEGNGHATTVADFIPKNLKQLGTIDLADAIFGWIKQESKEEKLPKSFDKQRAGRVFVTDALYQTCQNGIWYENEPLTPQILSGPKPSYFPHYLVQTSADKSQLKHYASQPVAETVIRGHKLYWHKGSDRNFKLPAPKKVIGSTKKVECSDTQTTLIKPINKGVSFKFNIHFENLSQVELGALLSVLSLSSDKSQTLETGKEGEKYCFSLGMGKPLGMGAVKIDYELHLSDRTSRYSNLFDGTNWKTGEENQSETLKKEQKSVEAFEKYILDWICCQDYPKDSKREQLQHLNQLPRIEMLLAMLRCDHRTPDAKQTRYMTIEPDNEYKDRPVLPTPLDVMGIPDNRRCDRTSNPSNSNLSKPIIQKSSPAALNHKMQSNSAKPKPKQKTDRDEDGGNINPLARPAKQPKR